MAATELDTRLTRETLAARVADGLRRRILSGELREGMQLKQEKLAGELGVSRVPLREALHQLEAEGFIVQKPYRGAVVAGLSRGELIERFEVRAELEVWLLGLAMERATAEDVAAARAAAALLADKHSTSEYSRLNWRFHEMLYGPAGRGYALDLIGRIYGQLERYVRLEFTLAVNKDQVLREHAELLDLYAARSPAAGATLRRHIMTTAEQLVRRLDEEAGVEPLA